MTDRPALEEPDQPDAYGRLVTRMYRWLALCGVAAVLLSWLYWGPRPAAGVAAGVIAAAFNFSVLHRALHSPSEIRIGGTALRAVLLAAGGYVIIELLNVPAASFLAGLLTLGAAAFLEALFQAFYARST